MSHQQGMADAIVIVALQATCCFVAGQELSSVLHWDSLACLDVHA